MWMLLPITLSLAGTVTLTGEQYAQLLPPDPDKPEDAPGVAVVRREVTVTPFEEDTRLSVTWQLYAAEIRWFEGRLADARLRISRATVDGKPLPIVSDEAGHHAVLRVEGLVTVQLEGVIDETPAHGLRLELLPATTGWTSSAAPIAVAGAVRAGGRWWGAGSSLEVGVAPAKPSMDRTLSTAAIGLGVTVGEAEVRSRAHVRVAVLAGSIDRVGLQVDGAGPDLAVKGPAVRSFERSGNRVEIALNEPVKDLVDLQLSWTSVTGESLPAPLVRVDGVTRHEWALQLARDGDLEVVPDLTGWHSIPASSLPAWGEGLVEGTPTAAYASTATPSGSLSLVSFTPVSGPPTLVDIASYTIATAENGRTLIRAHYQVRNDRGPHLRLRAPEGFRLIGVRVNNETTAPAVDGTGWMIPLQRSVETVDGLLSFPVEVILLGTDPEWARREERALPIPTVAAEVAVTRVTLYLPPGFENRLEEGDAGVVAEFSEGKGLTYGFAVGDTRAAMADELFQEAVSAWMKNEFDEGQELLDQLSAMGADNENIQRLQSNFDVVSGKYSSDSKGDVASERRLKEQARARAREEETEYRESLELAEQQALRGEYEAAEQTYQRASSIGTKLQQLEQDEAVDIRSENIQLLEKLEVVSKEVEKKKAAKPPVHAEEPEPFYDYDKAPEYSKTTEYAFEDVTIEGNLIMPSGAYGVEITPDTGAILGVVEGESGVIGEVYGVMGGEAYGVMGGATYEVTGETFETTGAGAGGVGYGYGTGYGYAEGFGAVGDAVPVPDAAPPDEGRVTVELDGDGYRDGHDEYDYEEMPTPTVDLPRTWTHENATITMTPAAKRGPQVRLPQISGGKRKDVAAAPPAAVEMPPPPPPPATPTPPAVLVPQSATAMPGGPFDAVAPMEPPKAAMEKPKAEPKPADKPTQPTEQPIEVTAAALSIVVPTKGEAVRYQHLLLPAGADFSVAVKARDTRRKQ